MTAILSTLARLSIIHDRSIQEVQSQMSLAIWVHDPAVKDSIKAVRESWTSTKPEGQPHPSGMSQRAAIWCKMVVSLREAYAAIKTDTAIEIPSGSKDQTITKATATDPVWQEALTHWKTGSTKSAAMATTLPPIMEFEIFRLKPSSYEFKPDKPWVWDIICTQGATQAFKQDLAFLAAYGPKPPGIHVTPTRRKDGGLVESLGEWLSKQPQGAGRGRGKGRGGAKGGGRGKGGNRGKKRSEADGEEMAGDEGDGRNVRRS